MGNNLSDEEDDDSDGTPKSYLDNYPNRLGHFKSTLCFYRMNELVANRRFKPTSTAPWYGKMNIWFTQMISIPIYITTLRFAICCGTDTVKKWRVRANVKLIVHNWDNEFQSRTYDMGNVWFDPGSQENAEVVQMTDISLEDLLDEELGFVRFDLLKVETDIRVLEVEGVHQPMVMNYRVPPENWKHRFTFKFLDEELYCSKAIMEAHCDSLTKGQISKRQNIKFRDPTSGKLEVFLDSLHGFLTFVTNRGKLEALLHYSDSFGIRSVAQKCETAVTNDLTVYDIIPRYLDLAVRYNLRRIIHAWLNRKKSIKKADLDDLSRQKMSGEVMKAIVKRVFDLAE